MVQRPQGASTFVQFVGQLTRGWAATNGGIRLSPIVDGTSTRVSVRPARNLLIRWDYEIPLDFSSDVVDILL